MPFSKFSIKKLIESVRGQDVSPAESPRSLPKAPKLPVRSPLYIHVGLDFGSAFTKVVIRDVNAGRSWPLVAPKTSPGQPPFLIPSLVYFGSDANGHHWLTSSKWDSDNLVLAFPKIALHTLSVDHSHADDTLAPYRSAAEAAGMEIDQFVYDAVCYFLAEVIRAAISSLQQSHDLGGNPEDIISVCMALPTENLLETRVKREFERALRRAFWYSLKGDSGENPIQIDLESMTRDWVEPTESELEEWQCSIFPEVSANMAAYTVSRASAPGLYKMFDVGAGTVDVSFFSFTRREGSPRLANFSGLLSFCGSSRIERGAAEELDGASPSNLERLRGVKEGRISPHRTEKIAIETVIEALGEEVQILAARSVMEMIELLPNQRQLNETRFIFVGGGAVRNPYEEGAEQRWSTLGRPHGGTLTIPKPPDLDLDDDRWFKRLTVAYGLSIDPANQPETTLPGDHEPIDRRSVRRPERAVAPSKDEC